MTAPESEFERDPELAEAVCRELLMYRIALLAGIPEETTLPQLRKVNRAHDAWEAQFEVAPDA